ncbi:MAG: cytochrome c oxidase subunit II [Thiotrichales bacterium]|nr:cytochrome c oxidase subunit II [Thiotrichales bacterium]
MHRRTPGRWASSGMVVFTLLALASTGAFAAWDLNLPVGVTPISKIVYDLHMLILWICVAIGVVVFGVMLISIVRHRKAAGAQAAQFHHSTFAEIAWTVVPIVILVSMAVPATTTLIEMEDTSDADLTVKVTGYQWKWKYEYIEDGVTVYSTLAPSSRQAIYEDPTAVENYLLEVDNPIVFPVDKKVRLLLTADDVIHAWWVPELGQKKDAIPGYINEIWTRVEEPGVYRGQCAELCGKDHGFMPIVVRAAPEEEYKAWVAERKMAQAEQAAVAMRTWGRNELMALGEKVYVTSCATCHQVDGVGVAGAFPSIRGSDVATGDVQAHLELVMDGRNGTAMKPFGSQLTDVELAAVVTYQRNAFGNATGDVVQPSMISAARNLNTGG